MHILRNQGKLLDVITFDFDYHLRGHPRFMSTAWIGAFILLLTLLRSIFEINLKKKFNLFLVSTYFLLATFGGHFVSASGALFLVIFASSFIMRILGKISQ
jgi:hypothetical protein